MGVNSISAQNIHTLAINKEKCVKDIQLHQDQKCLPKWQHGHCWLGNEEQLIFETRCSGHGLHEIFNESEKYQQCCGSATECGELFMNETADVVMWREHFHFPAMCFKADLATSSNFDIVWLWHTIAYVGWSLSLSALIPSVLIFICLKSLHKVMNIIHANLMISFILRSIFHFIFYEVVKTNTSDQMYNAELLIETIFHHEQLITDQYIHTVLIKPEFGLCRFVWLTYQFSIMTNHFWLLNEGVYLLKTRTATDSSMYKPNNW